MSLFPPRMLRGAAGRNEETMRTRVGGRQLWKVVGGERKEGMLARAGRDLWTTELRMRVAVGSIVEEIKLEGTRLHYRMIEGKGPEEGWITIRSRDNKQFVVKINEGGGPPESAAAPGEQLVFLPGDPVMVYSVSKGSWSEDGVIQQVAEKATMADGQRIPVGSVLVSYNGGRDSKWVTPAEHEQVLCKLVAFQPGDRVHVWSVGSGSWAEDGLVHEVATEPMVLEGQEVPARSVFVVYNGGQGMKCIVPQEQPQMLRLALPAPGWFPLGEPVHVWSVNNNVWFEDGVVEQVAAEDLLAEGQQVARGSVFVVYNKGQGLKWVMPWEQAETLRGTRLPLEEAPEEVAQARQAEAPEEEEEEQLESVIEPMLKEEDLEEETGELLVAVETWEPEGLPERTPALGLLFGTAIRILKEEEGWKYGRRLDGAEGWFPAEKVKPESEFRFNDSSSEEEEEQAAEGSEER